jgi:DNA-binding CsgD family transcriptional regulator
LNKKHNLTLRKACYGGFFKDSCGKPLCFDDFPAAFALDRRGYFSHNIEYIFYIFFIMTKLLVIFDSETSSTLGLKESAARLVRLINKGEWLFPEPYAGLMNEKQIRSIKAVRLGEWVFAILESVNYSAEVDAPELLSQRQRQVLYLLAEGLTNKQIAYKLKLSQRMVNLHLAAIKTKLGTKTNAQSVSKGTSLGYCRPFMRRRDP